MSSGVAKVYSLFRFFMVVLTKDWTGKARYQIIRMETLLINDKTENGHAQSTNLKIQSWPKTILKFLKLSDASCYVVRALNDCTHLRLQVVYESSHMCSQWIILASKFYLLYLNSNIYGKLWKPA